MALQVLLQHGMVTFAAGRGRQAEYTLHADRVLLLVRYVRWDPPVATAGGSCFSLNMRNEFLFAMPSDS